MESLRDHAKVSETDLERSLLLLDEALNSPGKRLLRVTKRTPLRRTSLIKKGLDATPDNTTNLRGFGETPTQLGGPIRQHDLSLTIFRNEASFLVDNMANVTGTLFLGQQPWKEAIDHLYMEFLESMQLHGSERQVFDTVLDFIKNCNHTLDIIEDPQFKSLQSANLKNSELKWLRNECDTWGLVYALYKNRLGGHRDSHTLYQQKPANPLSEKDTVIELYNNDNVTRECQIVVDWLERNAECVQREQLCMEHYTDKTVMWENTFHQLQNSVLSIAYKSSRPIISKLDPDAVLREHKPLHDLDMEDEAKLLKAMYYEIRCGHLERAKDICVHCGQPWRAATLEGWHLHHDPNYDSEGTGGVKLPIEGNPNRDLWKLIAWRMANDSRMPPYARAIHGALCGHLPALEGVCTTWSDLLWAYLRVLVDIRVEKELRNTMPRSYIPMPEEYWQNKFTLEEVFSKLGASRNPKISAAATVPDYIVQKYLILDHIPQLMEEMQEWSKTCNPQFLRLLAHLVLFFRLVGRSVRDDIGDSILEAYVKLLMSMREPQLVAYYVSTLPQEDQVVLYAQFLENVTEEDERLMCLDVADKAGLDVQTITKTVVENVRSRDWRLEAPDLQAICSPQDEKKISALEWVVFYPEQRTEAIWQANALMRQFLAMSKLEAARKAFNKIPIDSINLIIQQYHLSTTEDADELSTYQNLPSRITRTIREYLCHRTYLDAQEGFSEWFHHYHHAKPSLPVLPPGEVSFTERVAFEHRQNQYTIEMERWKLSMQHQTKIVKAQLYNVLLFPEGGWLVDTYYMYKELGLDPEEDDEGEDSNEMKCRQQQLDSLRQLCIPQVVLLLITLMHNMGEYQECIHLADLIVCEHYQIYKAYPKQKLGELLHKICESSLDLLNQKRDPWGQAVTF